MTSTLVNAEWHTLQVEWIYIILGVSSVSYQYLVASPSYPLQPQFALLHIEPRHKPSPSVKSPNSSSKISAIRPTLRRRLRSDLASGPRVAVLAAKLVARLLMLCSISPFVPGSVASDSVCLLKASGVVVSCSAWLSLLASAIATGVFSVAELVCVE